jgi:hypothetical protein
MKLKQNKVIRIINNKKHKMYYGRIKHGLFNYLLVRKYRTDQQLLEIVNDFANNFKEHYTAKSLRKPTVLEDYVDKALEIYENNKK